MKKSELEQSQEIQKILGDKYVFPSMIDTKNKIMRHDFVEKKQLQELQETYKKSEITTNINEQLQSLEERLLKKLHTPEQHMSSEAQKSSVFNVRKLRIET